VADILGMLAGLPTPEAVMALRPSAALQTRMSALLEKNRTEGLFPAEEQEWVAYQFWDT
jgi:hypothetical protein